MEVFMIRWIAFSGALHLFLAVALGAFGAHGLKGKIDSKALETFETGVRYHMYHALVLLILGCAGGQLAWHTYTGVMYNIGIGLFSGSLYLFVFTGARWLVLLTPIGGLFFLAGHALLAYSIFVSQPPV